jgi:hypothetical protein
MKSYFLMIPQLLTKKQPSEKENSIVNQMINSIMGAVLS